MTAHNNDIRAELLQQAIRLKKAAARSRSPDLSPRPADQSGASGRVAAQPLARAPDGTALAGVQPHQRVPRSRSAGRCETAAGVSTRSFPDIAFSGRHFESTETPSYQIVHPHCPARGRGARGGGRRRAGRGRFRRPASPSISKPAR